MTCTSNCSEFDYIIIIIILLDVSYIYFLSLHIVCYLKGIKDSSPSENASTSYLMNHRRHLYQTTNIVSKQQDGVDHAHKQVT